MTKVHHAGVDGVSGANLMSQLCSTEADAPAPGPGGRVGDASELEIAVSGAVKFATRPLKLVNALPSTWRRCVDTVRRARGGPAMAAPFAAPKTACNDNVTGHRNIAFAQLDLEDVKTVKNHFGVKVNDVVMALVSGVLRKFLLDRGELPEGSLVAMVPVSVHDKSDRPGRNQVSGMFSKLETQIDSPAERLKRRGKQRRYPCRSPSTSARTMTQPNRQSIPSPRPNTGRTARTATTTGSARCHPIGKTARYATLLGTSRGRRVRPLLPKPQKKSGETAPRLAVPLFVFS